MPRRPNTLQRILVAVLISAIAVPAATTALSLRRDRTSGDSASVVTETDESGVSSSATQALTSDERALLRRYTRARVCPDSLKKLPIQGFHALCRKIVGETAARDPVVGLLNHTAYIYRSLHPVASALPKFKLRMKMVQEALDPSNRRADTERPRPVRCLGGFEC